MWIKNKNWLNGKSFITNDELFSEQIHIIRKISKVLFTDEYFKEIAGKYIKPLDIISPNVGNSEYIDRLIISDVHIGMDNTGDLNTVALYAKETYRNRYSNTNKTLDTKNK